ncbi:flagellar basal-body MS-ring/collar protein FliF [Craterilacuibacter sp.]|uniref:flagellar basal-body MS-ring/collar protein FliF n=1 Tax=Craterilacuibacter sp. TaxID=2870909 RepID=UPI003F3C9D0E
MISRLRNGLDAWRTRAPALAMPASALRYLLPLLALSVLLTLALVFWLWRDDASYRPLFGADEKIAAADMMTVLDSEQIPYRLHPQSGQVLVPDAALGRARMALASKGVVARLPAGLEIMDQKDPLGVSQFVQDVRFRRGLEGELVQSMLALEPVKAARVHLSLPKSTSFVGGGDGKASASVVLTLKNGQSLSDEQVAAIIKLVSGSVSTLPASAVTLVDQAGNLLSARVDLSDGLLQGKDSEASTAIKGEVADNVRALLAASLGEGNYRLSVTADVDNDRVEETREQYGEAPKVTNEASRAETSSNAPMVGIPGSLSNLPIDMSASAPAGEKAGASRQATTRQYAYDRNITQIKRARGQLRRLNVAVVLNQRAAPDGKRWTPAQIANIESVLKNGLGVDAGRGDKLLVSALDFRPEPVPEPLWMDPGLWYEALRILGWAILGLLGYWLLARPLLAQLRRTVPAAAALPGERTLAAPSAPLALGATEQGAAALALPHRVGTVVPLLENYDLPPAGSSVDVLVDHLKDLAGKEPERVAEVVKQWVQKSGKQQQ